MTSDIIQIFSFLLSIIASALVIIVFIVSSYWKIRKSFPIQVNCWFCNTWTKVPYENKNSFDCPNCLQYNGFTLDGSYNKIIEAQHQVATNGSPTLRSSYSKYTNGFCESCNHNQQLKITQLANFTPLKDENYDIEIEHFRNQLEKAYELCKQCAGVLKSTLVKEKATIFGNHVFNIHKKGQAFYLNKSSKVIEHVPILVRIFRSIQGCIAIFVILRIIAKVTYQEQSLKLLPSYVLPYFELFEGLSLFISCVMTDSLSSFNSYFSSILEYGCSKIFSLFGLILQIFLFFLDSTTTTVKVNQLLCWMFISLTSWVTMKESFICVRLFQVFCAVLVSFNSFHDSSSIRPSKNYFKKLSKSTAESTEEYSDDEFDISSQSAKTYRSFCNEWTSSKNSLFNVKQNLSHNVFQNKTEYEPCTAFNTFNNAPNTARNLNNSTLYSNIRSSLEDLHLGNSTFKLNKTSPISFSRPVSPLSDRPKLILSPSKLKSVTQNSWVAGGFWRNEDGTIVPLSEKATLSRSSSQSSGFGSQIYERPSNLNNPFNSLPTSPKTSLSGEIDRFSLASEPPYYFHPVSPPPTWIHNIKCGYLSTPKPQFDHTFGNIHNTSNHIFSEFILPPSNRMSPMPLFNTNQPLGLFKLPQQSPNIAANGICHSFASANVSMNSQSPLVFSRNNEAC